MTQKKWRPFWSYDVEKTEQWLSKAAADGNRVIGLNRWTRLFSFEEVAGVKAEYQLVFDKSGGGMPRALEEAGWETTLTEGHWQLINNESDVIDLFPSREGIVKRNRVHSNVLIAISFLYGWQFLMMSVFMSVILFSSNEGNFQPSPMWIFTFLYFLQVIGVIWLAVHSTRKLRAFERKYFDVSLDEGVAAGKTFVKWKFGWKQAPDTMEKWLSEMSSHGNHLIRVSGPRFIFERGMPKCVSYVFDFQWKASPNYYDVHKSANWQLKYTSPYSFLKQALWAKEYDFEEEKPLLTYDVKEKKEQVRKVLLSNVGASVYSIAIVLFVAWLNYSIYEDLGWTLFGGIIVSILLVSLISPLAMIISSYKFVLRMRKE